MTNYTITGGYTLTPLSTFLTVLEAPCTIYIRETRDIGDVNIGQCPQVGPNKASQARPISIHRGYSMRKDMAEQHDHGAWWIVVCDAWSGSCIVCLYR